MSLIFGHIPTKLQAPTKHLVLSSLNIAGCEDGVVLEIDYAENISYFLPSGTMFQTQSKVQPELNKIVFFWKLFSVPEI